MRLTNLGTVMLDLHNYLRDQYEQAIEREGLGYDPVTFLEEFDPVNLATHEQYGDVLFNRYEDDAYAMFGSEYDTVLGDAITEYCKRKLEAFKPEDLEDVRFEIADRRDYNANSFRYYGVSKSNFYGVN